MVYEDFTTYTEVDSAGDLTVTANNVDIDTMREDAVSYVFKDQGANHFGDFEHLIQGTYTTSQVSGRFGIESLSNNLPLTQQKMIDMSEGLYATFFRSSAGGNPYQIFLKDYNTADVDTMDLGAAPPYTRYMTFKRTGTTATLKIYTDAARTVLEDTLTITCVNDLYRYNGVAASRGTAGQTDHATGDIDNLDLQEITTGVTTYGRLRGVVHWGIG